MRYYGGNRHQYIDYITFIDDFIVLKITLS